MYSSSSIGLCEGVRSTPPSSNVSAVGAGETSRHMGHVNLMSLGDRFCPSHISI